MLTYRAAYDNSHGALKLANRVQLAVQVIFIYFRLSSK